MTLRKKLLAALLMGISCTTHAQEVKNPINTVIDELYQNKTISEETYMEWTKFQREQKRRDALKEAQAKEKENQSKTDLNGKFRDAFSFESKDRQFLLNVGGRLQSDFRHFNNTDLAANTFDIRRAYITFTGKIHQDITFEVTGDVSNVSNNNLIDQAFINYQLTQGLQIRTGQFRMPFSLEEQTSSRFIDFLERSMMNRLVPGKERGFMVHGSPVKGFVYAVAISNGAGKGTNDTVAPADGKDIITRVGFNAAEYFDITDKVLHVGVAGSKGSIPSTSAISLSTEPRGITWFNTQPFSSSSVDRTRTAIETALAHRNVKFQAELSNFEYEGIIANQQSEKTIKGGYVEGMWLVTGEWYPESFRNGTFGRIKPSKNFVYGGEGTGYVELGLRYSFINADDFSKNTASQTTGTPTLITSATGAHAITLGMNWGLNPNTRVMVNLVKTTFDTPVTLKPNYNNMPNQTVTDERAITVRFAIDF